MDPHEDRANLHRLGDPISRRRLMQLGGAGAVGIGLGGLLTACGGGDGGSGGGTSTAGATTTGGGTPKRGGTLRIGATGGGSSDTLEAQSSLTTLDFLRAGALFEQLMIMDPKTGAPVPVLAESVEPNKDGTEWTIRLRKGVLFHDGKPFTAKDVLFSLRRIEKKEFPGLINLGPINLGAAKVVDDQTLRLPFKSPYSILPEALAGSFTIRMVPVGYDPKKPVGTGPFKFESFTAGQQSTFVRFADYWQNGKPYLDKLVITNFADETAQVNALQSGQVDLVDQLSYTSTASVKGGGGKVVVSKTAAFVPFTMRVDRAPFSDQRVRQALRLVVDRNAFNQQLFGGQGTVANDVFGAIDPAYDGTLPQREQDIEQAKSLLKAAGQSDLSVSLYSAPTGPGAEAGASVFVAQAKSAGVNVKLIRQDATQFWSQSYSKVPFALSFWNIASYLIMAGQGITSNAPFNEIHQTDASWQRLYDQAIKTVDSSARGDLVKQLLKFDYEKGGYIIPVYFPSIEGMTASVQGVTENITGFPVNGSNGLQDIWV
jgi:peptide/nickel transport system substrate-binding protein